MKIYYRKYPIDFENESFITSHKLRKQTLGVVRKGDGIEEKKNEIEIRIMKRKDIEKAAIDYSGRDGGVTLKTEIYAFMAGADWRINNVWHEVSERPDENEPTIIERENGRFSLHEKGYDGPWKYNVEQFNFKRWAYVKDLTPNTED